MKVVTKAEIQAISLVLLAIVTLAMGGCQPSGQGADRIAADSAAAQQVDPNLVFQNITLEQADEVGALLWQVRADQATYSPNQQVANVINPDGNLFQDGKAIYHIQAQEGEVWQDGNRILLRGQVVATDQESGAVLQGDELEWFPQRDVLVVRGNLRANHPKVSMTAQQARLANRQRRMDVNGQVVALTAEEPKLQLNADRLTWMLDADHLSSDRPVQVQRFEGDQVVDQANGNQAEVNLARQVIRLQNNARLTLAEPPLNIDGNSLIWNLENQTLVADQPVTVVQREEQVVVNSDRGRVNLEPRIAYLSGNVRAVGQRNQTRMTSNELVWNIPTQMLEAEGNVVYTQPDPVLTLRGPRAVGRLADQTVVVSGGRVVTEVIPGPAN